MSDLSGVTARRVFVSGRVQGVGFRAGTVEAALRSGVVGWVRNTEDGRVEVHVQGPGAAVVEFERWLEKGPRWARVDALSARNLEIDSTLETFEIRW